MERLIRYCARRMSSSNTTSLDLREGSRYQNFVYIDLVYTSFLTLVSHYGDNMYIPSTDISILNKWNNHRPCMHRGVNSLWLPHFHSVKSRYINHSRYARLIEKCSDKNKLYMCEIYSACFTKLFRCVGCLDFYCLVIVFEYNRKMPKSIQILKCLNLLRKYTDESTARQFTDWRLQLKLKSEYSNILIRTYTKIITLIFLVWIISNHLKRNYHSFRAYRIQ